MYEGDSYISVPASEIKVGDHLWDPLFSNFVIVENIDQSDAIINVTIKGGKKLQFHNTKSVYVLD